MSDRQGDPERLRDAAPEDRTLADILQHVYPDDSPPPPPDLWRAIEGGAARGLRRRRWRHLLRELLAGLETWQLAGGAAALLVLVVLPWLLLGRARLAGAPGAAPPAAGPVLLEASAARPRALRLRDGAVLRVAGAAEIDERPLAGRPLVALRAGRLEAAVAAAGAAPEPRLRVTTPEVEVAVSVPGARFAVDRSGAEETTVIVYEGVLDLRPTAPGEPARRLAAGERCALASGARLRTLLVERVDALVTGQRCEDPDSSLDRLLADPAGTDVSAAWYLKGSCLVRAGRRRDAIASLGRAAELSPDPTRADNALARAAQLEAELGPRGAVEAWRRYLLRFPQGLHRTSALRYLRRYAPTTRR